MLQTIAIVLVPLFKILIPLIANPPPRSLNLRDNSFCVDLCHPDAMADQFQSPRPISALRTLRLNLNSASIESGRQAGF
jgi:hypothetical protein